MKTTTDPLAFLDDELQDLRRQNLYRPLRVMSSAQGPLVEVDGRPRAKRGKLSGRKHLWTCQECGNRGIAPWAARLGHCPRCGHRVRSLHDTWLDQGKRKRKAPAAPAIREHALEQIAMSPPPFAAAEEQA